MSQETAAGRPDLRIPQAAGAPHTCYRIDDLVIDVGRARVVRNGRELALGKLSFDLLLALVEAAPNLVSTDDLMERVWPGLVVSPETMSQRVKLLRDALGDDPRQPRYVLGVRGRGYRLLAEVSRVESPSGGMATSATAAVPAPSDVSPARRRAYVVALIAAALLATGVGIVLLRNRASPAPSIAQQVETPATAEIPVRSVAVLPFENLSPRHDDDLIALGIAEAVLHQLANLKDLSVIARTSSFAVVPRGEDARAIGHRLNARYLVEGSVQTEKSRLRVTAQLIDSETGTHVWSIRFDRAPEDIFAVQDEIATQVAHALSASVDAKAGRQSAHGTQDIDAWLAYVQGRALAASRRSADLEQAKARFEEAIRIDPSFASAYVSLAEAHLLGAYLRHSEFWFVNGPILPDADRARVEELLAHALAIDDKNGEAYLVRGWMGGTDPTTAEADYRRGLALSPNNALGYERFARLLFLFPTDHGRFDMARRAEAYVLIDRARALDPLVPSGHLTKGIMMLWGRSDTKAANSLILQALEQDPNYYPALMHLAELRWCCEGNMAEAIRYGERALALEPNASWPQRLLVNFYLDIGEPDTARQVLEESREPDTIGQLPLLLYTRDWNKAAEIAFSFPTTNGIEAYAALRAVARYARATGERKRSREYIESITHVDWSGPEPTIRDDSHDMAASVELAAMLLQDGDATRGKQLLRAVLRVMEQEAKVRGDLWYGFTRPQALALLGENDAAIEALRKSFEAGSITDWWYRLESEPAYDALRRDQRFQAIREDVHNRIAAQRLQLDAMRVAGVVPARNSGRQASSRH